MPYMLVQTDLAQDITKLGDSKSDPKFMQHVGAVFDQNGQVFVTNKEPSIILDKLEKNGYRVITSCQSRNRITWTLHKA